MTFSLAYAGTYMSASRHTHLSEWSLNDPISDSPQTQHSLLPFTMSRAVVLFCFVLFAGYVTGNLIRNDDVNTKDVKISHDDFMISADHATAKYPIAPVDVENNNVETPAEVFGTDPPKKCAEIGQFVSI